MSRIGRMPVPIPSGVEISVKKNTVTVKGPKGNLTWDFPPEITVEEKDGQVVFDRSSDHRTHRAKHGLVRALVNNMIIGVTQGFSRKLNIQGVGYRAAMQGSNLELNVGYSHPVIIEPPENSRFEVTDKAGREFVIHGIDKAVVGETAARIRRVRPPEPYKGKGIFYDGEQIRRKAGKAGKAK